MSDCVFVLTELDLHSMADNPEDILDIAYRNYRQGKELFSINVYGCSLADILLTILITPLLFSIYHEVCELLFKSKVHLVGELTITVVSTHAETGSVGFPLRSGVRSLYRPRDRSVYCLSRSQVSLFGAVGLLVPSPRTQLPVNPLRILSS